MYCQLCVLDKDVVILSVRKVVELGGNDDLEEDRG